jgi:hypothetical protein
MSGIKSRYRPIYEEKYLGDINNIICRSNWERQFIKKNLDIDNPKIISWSSEELPIPYVSPLDNKIHRYYVDFIVRILQNDGNIKTFLIEIKPYKECIPPKSRLKNTKKYLTEMIRYSINIQKWKAARALCDKNGWEFIIVNEKNYHFI